MICYIYNNSYIMSLSDSYYKSLFYFLVKLADVRLSFPEMCLTGTKQSDNKKWLNVSDN